MGTADAAERHILYKQYAITAKSYAKNGRWVPHAEVNDGRGEGTEAHTVGWRGTHTFATRQLADERAFAMGKRWVDDRG